MTMWMENDGWRNEDTEGPYIDTLRTKGDWKVSRATHPHRDNSKYFLINDKRNIELQFDTVKEAKDYADNFGDHK